MDYTRPTIVDYGDEASGLMLRPNGSLSCYSGAGADERPLENPGTKDITVHANWTALRGDALALLSAVLPHGFASAVLVRTDRGYDANSLRRLLAEGRRLAPVAGRFDAPVRAVGAGLRAGGFRLAGAGGRGGPHPDRR